MHLQSIGGAIPSEPGYESEKVAVTLQCTKTVQALQTPSINMDVHTVRVGDIMPAVNTCSSGHVMPGLLTATTYII